MLLSCHARVSAWIHIREIWSLNDCNWTQTHNHLVQSFGQFGKMVEYSFMK